MNNTQIVEAQASEVAPKKPNALMSLANRLAISPEKLQETLKKTVFKSCRTDEEFAVLVAVSNEYDLNPLTKQIYAFPAKGGGVEPIVSIDGWLKIINSQPNFDGMEVTMSPDGEEATCKIFTKDRAHPTVITEYKEECYRKTEPWNTMPKRMLRHKAIMQCGRVAFGISGIFDEDEAKDISNNKPAERNVTPRQKAIDPFAAQPSLVNGQESMGAASPECEVSSVQCEGKADETKKPEASSTENEPKGSKGEAKILNVEKTEGVNGTRAWQKFVITLKTTRSTIHATTFSTRIGGIADFNIGKMATVWVERDEHGYKLNELELQESTEGSLC